MSTNTPAALSGSESSLVMSFSTQGFDYGRLSCGFGVVTVDGVAVCDGRAVKRSQASYPAKRHATQQRFIPVDYQITLIPKPR